MICLEMLSNISFYLVKLGKGNCTFPSKVIELKSTILKGTRALFVALLFRETITNLVD